MREGEFVSLSYSTRNPIEYWIPSLFYEDGGLLNVPCESSGLYSQDRCLPKMFDIWSADWIHESLYASGRPLVTFAVISVNV